MNTNDFQNKMIADETQRVLYWIEQAIAHIKNGESAVYSLLTAVNHASSLDIHKFNADEEMDFNAIFEKAQALAKKEMEKDA